MCSSPIESAPSRGLLSNREPRRGVTFVAEKRLERRGTGTFARTPLRPIRLTGCHTDRTHREAAGRTGQAVVCAVPFRTTASTSNRNPRGCIVRTKVALPQCAPISQRPVPSAPRHARKIQIRSPTRADAIGLRAALTEGHPCTRGPEKPTEVVGNTHACLLLARDQRPFRNGVSADRDPNCRRRTTRVTRRACSRVPRRCSRDDRRE
jgi:hypothetical protein